MNKVLEVLANNKDIIKKGLIVVIGAAGAIALAAVMTKKEEPDEDGVYELNASEYNVAQESAE